MQHESVSLLLDIREAAEYITDDTADATLASFLLDRRMRQLVERNFVTIGEACNRLRRLDLLTSARISNLDQIIGFRNILIHGYESIDPETVWDVVQKWLPILQVEVEELIQELSS